MYIFKKNFGESPYPSEMFMRSQQARCALLAKKLGITILISRFDNSLEFKFNNINDAVHFERQCFNPQNKVGGYKSVLHLPEGQLSVIHQAWLEAVTHFTATLGIRCDAVIENDELLVDFDCIEDRAIHANAENNGRYERDVRNILACRHGIYYS